MDLKKQANFILFQKNALKICIFSLQNMVKYAIIFLQIFIGARSDYNHDYLAILAIIAIISIIARFHQAMSWRSNTKLVIVIIDCRKASCCGPILFIYAVQCSALKYSAVQYSAKKGIAGQCNLSM